MNGPIGARNLWLEVTDDTFCEPVQLTFLRAGEPLRARGVDLDGDGPRPVHALDRGDDGELRLGPAFACAIEESGSGMAWLVYGGNAGLVVARPGATPDPATLAADSGLDFEAYLIVARGDLDLDDG